MEHCFSDHCFSSAQNAFRELTAMIAAPAAAPSKTHQEGYRSNSAP